MTPVDAIDTKGVQLPYLETFSKAAEVNSFTGAAKALGMSQAAVSLRIQALERRLGKPLFRRHGGRVLLTEDGHCLYDYAQKILDLHTAAQRAIVGRNVPVAGDLFIAASSIPGDHLLPALLSVFRRKFPHIRVHANVSDSMVVLGQVERGDVSLGLVGRKLDNSNLNFRYLLSDRMVLVVPPSHILGKKKNVTVRQLVSHPLVLREIGSGLRHCFEKAVERAGHTAKDFQVVLELGSNEAIKQAVRRGVGVAVLSAFAVGKEIKSGQLKALEVRDLHCDRDMFIVQDQRRVLPFPARLFLNFLETKPIPALSP